MIKDIIKDDVDKLANKYVEHHPSLEDCRFYIRKAFVDGYNAAIEQLKL